MATENLCTRSAIDNYMAAGYPSGCAYVQDSCADEESTVNFFNFYYCSLDQNLAYFIPFSIAFILIAFYCISSVTERYLEPALSNIAKSLKFSESLAGVTLVSLANGAPDVIAAYAAGANANDGILVPLGALFGAGSFTVCIVLCVCIFVSPNGSIQAEKDAISRDCIFYLISCLYFLAWGLVGSIYGYTAGGLFVMYVVFIIMVLWAEVKFRRAVSQRLLAEDEETRKRESFLLHYHHDKETIENYMHHKQQICHVQDSVAGSLVFDDDLQQQLQSLQTAPSQNLLKNKSFGMRRYSPHSHYSKMLFEYNSLKHIITKEASEVLQKNLFGKICLLIVIPFRVIADLTIPASNDEQWVKPLAILHPFPVTAFLIWQFGLMPEVFGNFIGLGVWLGFCLVLSLLIWKLTLKKKAPQGVMGFLFVTVAFVASAVWINLLANIIVDYVTLLSVFTGLPLNYIGLTLLAWGNSAPDFFVDTTLARKGLGQAAISGVFAGQFFNIAIGFGLTLVRQVILFGDREFDLKTLSNTAIISILLIGILIVNLVITMIYGYKNNYLLKKNLAVYMLISYILFFVAVTVLSCF